MKKLPFQLDDETGLYRVSRPVSEDDIYHMVKELSRLRFANLKAIHSANDAGEYYLHQLNHLEHEIFCVLLLDNQHRILRDEPMFRGTISGAAVYPREVVKLALKHNAAAVIFAHNHPSGFPEPSQSDIEITHQLRDALNLVDIRTLDHIIVGGGSTVSMTELGHI